MPDPSTLTLHTSSPEHTCRLAQALAPLLGPGDVILLSGDVGAGKTHFARCLIQASLLQPEDVPSPTYTLVQTYPCQQGEIWHADLYRLSQISELEELGLFDAFSWAICLIEWPDRLHPFAPLNALNIHLLPGDDDTSRRLDIHWSDPRWNDKLKGLADA